ATFAARTGSSIRHYCQVTKFRSNSKGPAIDFTIAHQSGADTSTDGEKYPIFSLSARPKARFTPRCRICIMLEANRHTDSLLDIFPHRCATPRQVRSKTHSRAGRVNKTCNSEPNA